MTLGQVGPTQNMTRTWPENAPSQNSKLEPDSITFWARMGYWVGLGHEHPYWQGMRAGIVSLIKYKDNFLRK